jgi:hypothetical protein
MAYNISKKKKIRERFFLFVRLKTHHLQRLVYFLRSWYTEKERKKSFWDEARKIKKRKKLWAQNSSSIFNEGLLFADDDDD